MRVTRGAIVVGGAGGIGSAICRRLAAEGYRVTIADSNVAGSNQVLQSLKGEGHAFTQFDIYDGSSVCAAFDAIEARSPAAALVVATGGPVVPQDGSVNLMTMAMTAWERTVAFNLTGVFSCVQKFAQQRAAVPLELSRIVIIGSSVGFSAGSGTDIAYVSSKAALFGFSRQVACELAPLKITVNTVAPGPVETPEFMRKTSPQMRAGLSSLPLVKRLALPDEIAAGVAYLVSPEASYVTGSVLDINGGIHLR